MRRVPYPASWVNSTGVGSKPCGPAFLSLSMRQLTYGPLRRVALLEKGMAAARQISPHYDDVLREVAARIDASGSVGKSDIAALAFWKRIPYRLVG